MNGMISERALTLLFASRFSLRMAAPSQNSFQNDETLFEHASASLSVYESVCLFPSNDNLILISDIVSSVSRRAFFLPHFYTLPRARLSAYIIICLPLPFLFRRVFPWILFDFCRPHSGLTFENYPSSVIDIFKNLDSF